jgi:hypothetical protein
MVSHCEHRDQRNTWIRSRQEHNIHNTSDGSYIDDKARFAFCHMWDDCLSHSDDGKDIGVEYLSETL